MIRARPSIRPASSWLPMRPAPTVFIPSGGCDGQSRGAVMKRTLSRGWRSAWCAWRTADPGNARNARKVSRMGTDTNIEAAVQKELDSDPLVDAHDIVVEVTDGAVSLTGTVPSQAQQDEAAAAARRV